MADVNIDTVVDADIQMAGKFFVYALFAALAGVIGIVIIIALAVYIIKAFNLGHMFKR